MITFYFDYLQKKKHSMAHLVPLLPDRKNILVGQLVGVSLFSLCLQSKAKAG